MSGSALLSQFYFTFVQSLLMAAQNANSSEKYSTCHAQTLETSDWSCKALKIGELEEE